MADLLPVEDKARLRDLIRLNHHDTEGTDADEALDRAAELVRTHQTPGMSGVELSIIALVLCVFSWLLGGPFPYFAYLLGAVIAALLVKRHLTGRQWWIVPGGIASRALRPFLTGPRVRLYTPKNSSLLLDLSGGRAMVLDGGETITFRATRLASWGILAGWISTARAPTFEEIDSLLDPDKPA